MALFGSRKKNTEVPADVATEKVVKTDTKVSKKTSAKKAALIAVPRTSSVVSHVIRQPRITEKASLSAAQNVYVFEVATTATKHTIAEAVRELYNVIPVRVRVAAIPTKKVFVRGKIGTKNGGKKAYVYIKKGETIEII